ncbi:hypothetical protein RJ639_028712 [Escallonia herrerae]|uniref:Protein TIC 20 n=1 Tax=Escallonia herrerae TaxID=1293975 RepID=A0AA88XBN3_9ASTE|nr:hypothetical protein RJ639_028712 [Escallonia herrerae]
MIVFRIDLISCSLKYPVSEDMILSGCSMNSGVGYMSYKPDTFGYCNSAPVHTTCVATKVALLSVSNSRGSQLKSCSSKAAGVMKRKEWPHFFRFHVIMGMLLEIVMQVVMYARMSIPPPFYWDKVDMHLFTAFTFAHVSTALECTRCSLAGMYAEVPFLCVAAYIQISYE